MSRQVDFTFNNLGSIGYDHSSYTQDDMMNTSHASYILTNLFSHDNVQAFNLQTQTPTMNMKGTFGVGPRGFNINESSNLLNSKLTNLNCKISLQERAYKTVPYLGKGNVDVGLENVLRFGETLKEKKSTVQLNEVNPCDIGNYPMDAKIKKNITNPSNLIEEHAVQGWIRGGLPSREIYKEQKYQCN